MKKKTKSQYIKEEQNLGIPSGLGSGSVRILRDKPKPKPKFMHEEILLFRSEPDPARFKKA